jgi:transposase-like protein
MSKKRGAKVKSSDDEYQCQACKKNFPNKTLYETHVKMKHPSRIKEKKK